MIDCVREATQEERIAQLAKKIESLERQVQSLQEVIAWLNTKIMNQEKNNEW